MLGPGGQARGSLFVDDEGGCLFVFDSKGNMQAFVKAQDPGGAIGIMSHDSPQIVMETTWDGGKLTLFAQSESTGATIAVTGEGGAIELFDDNGQSKASLP